MQKATRNEQRRGKRAEESKKRKARGDRSAEWTQSATKRQAARHAERYEAESRGGSEAIDWLREELRERFGIRSTMVKGPDGAQRLQKLEINSTYAQALAAPLGKLLDKSKDASIPSGVMIPLLDLDRRGGHSV